MWRVCTMKNYGKISCIETIFLNLLLQLDLVVFLDSILWNWSPLKVYSITEPGTDSSLMKLIILKYHRKKSKKQVTLLENLILILRLEELLLKKKLIDSLVYILVWLSGKENSLILLNFILARLLTMEMISLVLIPRYYYFYQIRINIYIINILLIHY